MREITVREEPETQGDDPREPPADGAGEPKAAEADEVDDRPEVQELLQRMKASAAELGQLLRECSSHWGYEDFVYRFYHQSAAQLTHLQRRSPFKTSGAVAWEAARLRVA